MKMGYSPKGSQASVSAGAERREQQFEWVEMAWKQHSNLPQILRACTSF
jgi:hypothetical protein